MVCEQHASSHEVESESANSEELLDCNSKHLRDTTADVLQAVGGLSDQWQPRRFIAEMLAELYKTPIKHPSFSLVLNRKLVPRHHLVGIQRNSPGSLLAGWLFSQHSAKQFAEASAFGKRSLEHREGVDHEHVFVSMTGLCCERHLEQD